MTRSPNGTRRPQSEFDAKWEIVQLRLLPEFAKTIDDVRRTEEDLPPRTEMIRRLIADGIEARRARQGGDRVSGE